MQNGSAPKKMRQDSEKAEPQTGKKMYAKRKRPAGASAGPASNRANPNNLVELIVVLVILAILAAILVPALLGWIDEARKKQYVLEARSIYMAAQAMADEAYANAGTSDELGLSDLGSSADNYKRIKELSDISVTSIDDITVKGQGDSQTQHDKYTIVGMGVKFTSGNGTQVAARLTDSKWDVNTAAADKDAPSIPDYEQQDNTTKIVS